MTAADWTMDGALALALPFLAWRALVTDNLHKAVVLFVSLGLLAAVTWARLGAPDVALVEASVGAGLTGALLVSALGWVEAEPPRQLPWLPRVALPVLLLGFGVGLSAVILGLPAGGPGLGDEVLARLEDSGASHPVTAVLLNFRGYDTLLEIAVLLATAVGAGGAAAGGSDDSAHPLLPVLVRLLVPGIILVAGYLLWAGAHAPGGAFQGGAILGGSGILLILAKTTRPPDLAAGWVRAGLLVGPLVFLAVAAAPMAGGAHLLEYPPRWAGALILVVEAALTLSIALILTAFFAAVARTGAPGGHSPQGGRP